jgi:putative PEP-CTERM system histidine kinase
MTHATLQAVLALTGAALSIGVAIFGLAMAPRHVVHRTFAVGMGCLALMQLGAGLSVQSMSVSSVWYWERVRLLATACLPGVGLLFSVSFARFNSRDHVRHWRWAIAMAFGLPLGLVVVWPQALYQDLAPPPPLQQLYIPLDWAGYGFYMLALGSGMAIIAQLEKTLRASAGRVRAQIKFVVLGMGCVFATQIYTASQALLLASRHTSWLTIEAVATLLANVFVIAAMLRRRRFDVQLYVARPFPFHAVSLKAVVLYLLLAVGRVVAPMDNGVLPPSGVLWGFALSAGVLLVLFSDWVRYESRRWLNRHGLRSRYDYRRIWTLYTQRMASVVDVGELCHVIARLVSDTFGVPAVTVWLLQADVQDRFVIGGSTVCWDRQTWPCEWEATVQALMAAMRRHTMPVDFASPHRQGLQAGQRDVLQALRIRYGTVLVSGQQVLGMITLSDRLTQEPLIAEDVDLFKTIAEQAAASLQNANLSKHLLEVRQMHAFQTVSTFFVHDLKNLAAKLSLMVQNLPAHYDNPEFRDDMLQVISKSVTKMNAMCGRLSLFTHVIELHPTQVDLNELIQETVAELSGTSSVQWHQELLSLPPIRVDREQIKKVVGNLLLNAIEAVDQHGEIRLTTAWVEPWVVVTISDNGCGMSHAFLADRLFEPFQTTKSQGLGIGMFHSKKIIEAHHGRIEAESVDGKGSTFRVLLPTAKINPENPPNFDTPEVQTEATGHTST